MKITLPHRLGIVQCSPYALCNTYSTYLTISNRSCVHLLVAIIVYFSNLLAIRERLYFALQFLSRDLQLTIMVVQRHVMLSARERGAVSGVEQQEAKNGWHVK